MSNRGKKFVFQRKRQRIERSLDKDRARAVLGMAFDEADSLFDPDTTPDPDDDTADMVALVVKHGAAPDPWGSDE